MRRTGIAAALLLVICAVKAQSTVEPDPPSTVVPDPQSTVEPDPKPEPEPEGRGLFFGWGWGTTVEHEGLKDILCPGVGSFALKGRGRENCRKFFECWETFKPPVFMRTCAAHERFNRISRNCMDKVYENCKWCRNLGRHEDKTSKRHFIECVAGSVGIRYKCKEGPYDSALKGCRHTVIPNVTDVTVDVEYDPPLDGREFMQEWQEAEKDEKHNTGSVDKSIESRFVQADADGNDADDDDDAASELA